MDSTVHREPSDPRVTLKTDRTTYACGRWPYGVSTRFTTRSGYPTGDYARANLVIEPSRSSSGVRDRRGRSSVGNGYDEGHVSKRASTLIAKSWHRISGGRCLKKCTDPAKMKSIDSASWLVCVVFRRGPKPVRVRMVRR